MAFAKKSQDSAEIFALRPEDVARLLRDPSEANRARVARKVGASIASEGLSDNERALAEEIVRLFARDAVVQVRVALAESVKSTPSLPRDVAKRLANDIHDVALPILQFSNSLTDEDLIEIVRGGDSSRQAAIAGRNTIALAVVDSVIENGSENAIIELINNKRADIDEVGFGRVLSRFGHSRSVPDAMARRQQLPSSIVARLLNLVSESLQANLVARYHLTPSLAKDLAVKTRERAIKALHTTSANSTDPFLRAREMVSAKRLSPQIMLRALCLGDVPLFEAGLAVLADIPLTNARVLVNDSGGLGLKALLHKASIPHRLLPMFRVALAIAREVDSDIDNDEFVERRRDIAVRTLMSFDDSWDQDVDYVLSKLDGFAAVPEGASEIVHYGA